jgi:hypothetical protein
MAAAGSPTATSTAMPASGLGDGECGNRNGQESGERKAGRAGHHRTLRGPVRPVQNAEREEWVPFDGRVRRVVGPSAHPPENSLRRFESVRAGSASISGHNAAIGLDFPPRGKQRPQSARRPFWPPGCASLDFLLELRDGLRVRPRRDRERDGAQSDSNPDVTQHSRLPSQKS